MATIKPFRGILYNPSKAGDPSKVMAPPYDVISESMQENFYSLNDYNVIRLILGKIKSSDNKSNNRYTRAKAFFTDWLKEGVLTQDKRPSIYIYEQGYSFKGKMKTRLGFISLMKIEDPHTSHVLPHEYTFAKPKKDRFELLKATRTNLSPIFSLFEDEGSSVMDILKARIGKKPLIDVEQDGVTHRVWRLSEPSAIRRMAELMDDKEVFIADGHHRYEVALNFRDSMRRSRGGRGYDYIMVYFSNLDLVASTILSTHRVIRSIRRLDFQKTISDLKEYFYIEGFKDKEKMLSRMEEAKRDESIFGMYHKDKFFTLKAKEGKTPYRWLDVTILHQVIFDHILKVKEKVAKKDNVVYTRDVGYALRLVDEENYEIAFFLNPPGIEQVRDAARSHDRMPHKTTYFYPKPLSGLVFYKMEGV